MTRPSAPPRIVRTAAMLFALGVFAALALPMLVCVASASGVPATPAGQVVADASSAALGSISRVLHGDGCVRLDPWPPLELAGGGAAGSAPLDAIASHRAPPYATASVIGAEPQRRL